MLSNGAFPKQCCVTARREGAEGRLGVFKHYGFWQCMDTARGNELPRSLWDGGNAPWKVWGD